MKNAINQTSKPLGANLKILNNMSNELNCQSCTAHDLNYPYGSNESLVAKVTNAAYQLPFDAPKHCRHMKSGVSYR